MKLKKLVMTGYRSVKQQETLIVDDRVTILIGANDHGKSNLLAAIRCLNDDAPIVPDDKNWDTIDSSLVEIKWFFSATDEVLEKLRQLGPKPPGQEPEPALTAQPQPSASPAQPVAQPAPDAPPESAQPVPPVQSATEPAASPEVQAAPSPPEPVARSQLSAIPEPNFPMGGHGEIVFSRDSATNKVRVVALPVEVPISNEGKALSLRPVIELFEAPRGNVTDQVNRQQLDSPDFEFMQGIFRQAGLWEHRDIIFAQNDTTSKLLDKASEDLTRILNDTWNQGKDLKWKLEHTGTNGDHIVIKMQDPAIKGRYTRPSLRSSGFRTYFLLSMIIYARTKNKPSNSNIYLFDEPGTYLHPSAQLDLQRSFEAIADQAQIIYTTHSLFLVSKNYPERNRVISKNKQGTKIDQKPFSKNWKSVRESLGILLSNNFLIAEKTLLVEGPSDIIYLLDAIRKFKTAGTLDIDLNDLSIVDAGDARNYLAMSKLMLSEGRDIVALLDGDAGGNSIEAGLKKLCAAEIKAKKLKFHRLPTNKSSEDVFADLDTLRAAARAAYDQLVNNNIRKSAKNLKIEEQIQQIAPTAGKTLGKTLDDVTETWFDPPEKISKLLIATFYEDLRPEHLNPAPEDSLAALEEIKDYLNLRGEKSKSTGVFEEAD